MADLGNIGFTLTTSPKYQAYGPFTRTKSPTSVLVNIEDAPIGSIIALFFRGVLVSRTRVDENGDALFYDLDDGNYTAEVVYSADSAGEGNAWSVSVTGTTVVVTPIASSGINGRMSFS